MNRLAQRIRDERLKAGLSEKELAKKCGLQVAYILQIESGKKIINEQIADQILGKLGASVTSFSEQAATETVKVQPQKVKKQEPTKPLAPNANWSSALKQLIYGVPVHNISSFEVIDKILHPVIDNKVEGHQGDKLYYVRLERDMYVQKRLLKGDDILILKSKQLYPNQLMHFKYGNKAYIGLLQTQSNKEVVVQNDLMRKTVPQKDIEILGLCLSVRFKLTSV
jgi:transcriptional regulator with XRE-family HTH domain